MTINDNQSRLHPVKRAGLVRRIEVNWQDRALCAKFPADDWFPLPSDSEAVAQVVEVCTHCPVRLSCLAAALVVGEENGIWGGTTESDRTYGLAALARGASVPAVLEQLLATPRPAGEHEGGEAA